MWYKYSILIHVLAACIWTGGHLVLALSVLPDVLKHNDVQGLMKFEGKFEKIGIPSLLLLVITGFYQALEQLPIGEWFNFSEHISKHISLKIIFLMCTFILAMHARLKLIPQIEKYGLRFLSLHIHLVTAISVLMIILGVSFRFNIL
jgi:putative copper export protein